MKPNPARDALTRVVNAASGPVFVNQTEPYTVLGLSGDDRHVELHGTPWESTAREWIAGYTRNGDFGGYYGIALIAPDGEWLDTFDAPDTE